MATPLADTLARRLDLSPEVVRRTLPAFLRGLRNEVEEKGRAEVPGLGTFARAEDGALTFEPDETLARAVNRHYAGLEPLLLPEAPQAAVPEEPEPAEEDWQQTDADEDHPLGPLPTPEYEEADYSVVGEGAAEKEPSGPVTPRTPPGRKVLLPSSLTFAALSSEWAQNTHLAPENLTGARLLSPEVPETAPAPEAPETAPAPAEPVAEQEAPPPAPEAEPAVRAEDKEPVPPSGDGTERRPAALPWMLGLLALLVVGFGAWYALGETGLVAGPFAATSSSIPADEEAPEEPASDLTADTAQAAAGAASDTTLSTSDEEAPAEEEPEVELAPAGIDRSDGGWTLVVASRPERAEAEELMRDFRERFSDSGFAVDLFTATVEGDTHHRIAVGRFETTDEALQAKEAFSDHYPESAWLLRIEPN